MSLLKQMILMLSFTHSFKSPSSLTLSKSLKRSYKGKSVTFLDFIIIKLLVMMTVRSVYVDIVRRSSCIVLGNSLIDFKNCMIWLITIFSCTLHTYDWLKYSQIISITAFTERSYKCIFLGYRKDTWHNRNIKNTRK